jgi:hypothetical protein
MPAKREAAQAATPIEPPIETPEPEAPADEWGNWRYLGEHRLTYAAIPVTVEYGDVITYPGLPADDGRWESTDAEVTRHRDNHQEG